MRVSSGISVVVPVYNSEQTLSLLVQRLQPVLESLSDQFEVILVNDGSQDKSWQVIEQLTEQHKYITGINLMRNFGQHNALLCGIRSANFDIIVTLDDDLQNPPEEIPLLLTRLAEGYDLVYGSPDIRHHGFLRNLATRMTKLALQKVMGVRAASRVSAFRAFRTDLRKAFASYQAPLVSMDVLLSWGTKSVTYVTVAHHPRTMGQSNYSLRKLITHALTVITGFSVLPLQFATYLGFTFTILGFLVFVYVVGRFLLLGYSVPGFPFLASIIAIFSGVQLFFLGVIGEYLARLYKRSLDQPAYTIRTIVKPGRKQEHDAKL